MEPEVAGEATSDTVTTHERLKHWGVQVADILTQPVSTNAALMPPPPAPQDHLW